MDTINAFHAGRPLRDSELLVRFREANPHLKPFQGTRVCNAFWHLLSPRHREDKCLLRRVAVRRNAA